MRQAAFDAGREEAAIARKGMAESGQPLVKEVASHGVAVTQLAPAEREASMKATRPVVDQWKNEIGPDLGTAAEKAITAQTVRL